MDEKKDNRSFEDIIIGYSEQKSGSNPTNTGEKKPEGTAFSAEVTDNRGHNNKEDVFNQYEWYYKNQNPSQKKKNRGLLAIGISLLVVLGIGLLGLAGIGAWELLEQNLIFSRDVTSDIFDQGSQTSDNANKSAPSIKVSSKPSANQDSGYMTTQEIVRKVSPSIVGIAIYNNISLTPIGEGAGIVISEDGYIATNEHVISGANMIKVVFNSGEQYEAKLIGSDVRTDLAVIKIEAKNLKVATFGNSDEIEVGEPVIAIGNPGGLDFLGSVTAGIISGVDRKINKNDGYTLNCLQTDAAINPGNSGGALINMYGQVIGINSAKLVQLDYEGIGFAIPSNDALPILTSLSKYGYVKGRVKIGIICSEIDEITARQRNIPAGIFISGIDPETDVYKKGVRPGDIITELNGKKITSLDQLLEIQKNKKPGDTIKITVFRRQGGVSQTKVFEIQLMEDKGQRGNYIQIP